MAAKGGAIPQEGAGIRQKRLPGLQELTVSSMNMRNSPERNRQEGAAVWVLQTKLKLPSQVQRPTFSSNVPFLGRMRHMGGQRHHLVSN